MPSIQYYGANALLFMTAFVKLTSGRICLRPWRDEDRDAFAAMNSDARVMEFFRQPLSRGDSDAMVDRIEKHFEEHSFGLWAVEIPGVAPFVGFTGFSFARFDAPLRLAWKLAGVWVSSIGDAVTQRKQPGWR
jgi:RimJ/RimL family protein N-acetyltransferase